MRNRNLWVQVVLVVSWSIFLFNIAVEIAFADAGRIAVRLSDITTWPNYIEDPLLSPYFGTGTTTIIDFEGPWSPPDTGNFFNLGLVGSTYNSSGIEFGANDTFMGGQPGFGWITPTTVVGNNVYPYDGPITIDVVVPGTNTPTTVTSIGVFVADGPTNDVVASFYDLNNNLLGSVTAFPDSVKMFLGWSDPVGIHRVVFTSGTGDDYFIDNLTFGGPPPPPSRLFGPPGATYPTAFASDPVNTGTGNYAYQHLDLIMPGRGIPFAFQRTYNSQETYAGPLGHGWTHSYNIFLTVNPDNSVTVKWGDGHEILYHDAGGGNYTPRDAGVFDTLVKNPDGTFTITQKELTQYRFAPTGDLTAIVDKNGHAVNLSYDGLGNLAVVIDTVGRAVLFTYNGDNRIIQITDPLGRTTQYTYNATGDLATVTDPGGQVTTYTYNADHRVTEVVLPNGDVLLRNTYNAAGQVSTQENGRGDVTQFAYDTPGARQTTVTAPLGNATIHTYDSLIRIIQETDALGNSVSYTYNANNNRTGVTDKNGNTTLFSYDGVGNVTQITDPLGNAISVEPHLRCHRQAAQSHRCQRAHRQFDV